MESKRKSGNGSSFSQMPLHYPRYAKKDYQQMPEWMIDRLLADYGLSTNGDLAYKREFAMGAFLWPERTQEATHRNPTSTHFLSLESFPSKKRV